MNKPVETLKLHPLCVAFPQADEDEFALLHGSIKEFGLQEPIILYEGMILDGRSRYHACLDLKLKPKTKEYKGDNPVAFVMMKNLARRHLSPSQVATIGVELYEMQRLNNQDGDSWKCVNLHNSRGISVSDLAEMLNVSKRSIETARTVKKCSEELHRQVKSDQVTLNAAATVSKLPESERNEVAKKGPEAVKEKAAEMRAAKNATAQPTPPKEPAAAPKQEPPQTELDQSEIKKYGPDFCYAMEGMTIEHNWKLHQEWLKGGKEGPNPTLPKAPTAVPSVPAPALDLSLKRFIEDFDAELAEHEAAKTMIRLTAKQVIDFVHELAIEITSAPSKL